MQNIQLISLRKDLKLVRQLVSAVPAIVYAAVVSADGILVRTSPTNIRAVALFIRNSTYLQFRSLVDIAVVDRLLPTGRFIVNYLFLSAAVNQRLTVQLFANETSTISSLVVSFANGQRLFAAAG